MIPKWQPGPTVALFGALGMQRLIYQLPKPRPDGQTVLSLTRMDFFGPAPALVNAVPPQTILPAKVP